MLDKSQKFGTVLTVGPRLKALLKAGHWQILWEEKFPDQEDATNDGRGRFQHQREWIETASLEAVFDLYLRGDSLCGFSEKLLRATADFRKIVVKGKK